MVNNSKHIVIMTPEVNRFLRSTMRGYNDQGIECAVHLFGLRHQLTDGSRVFTIMGASNVGPKALCKPAICEPDVTHGQLALDALNLADPGLAYEVLGEAHLHPMPMHHLSSTDCMALREASADHPYLAVLLSNDHGDLRMQAFVAEQEPSGKTDIRLQPIEIDEEIAVTLRSISHDHHTEKALQCQSGKLKVQVQAASVRLKGKSWVGCIPRPGPPLVMVQNPNTGSAWCIVPRLIEHSFVFDVYERDQSSTRWKQFGYGPSKIDQIADWIVHQATGIPSSMLLDSIDETWHVVLDQSILESIDDEPVFLDGKLRSHERWLALSASTSDEPVASYGDGDFSLPRVERVADRWMLQTQSSRVEVHPWNPNDIGIRELDLPSIASISGKKVLLAGLGSIGSRLAIGLASCGVKVVGIDRGRYKPSNAYPRYPFQSPVHDLVGRLKSDILEEHERELFGTKHIKAHDLDLSCGVDEFELLAKEFKPDLAVISTDTADSRIDSGVVLRRLGIPQLHAGFSDGAASIELSYYGVDGPCPVCRGMPGRDAGMSIQDRSQHYGIEQHGVPALNANIELGAAITLRSIVSILAADDCDQGASEVFRMNESSGDVLWFSHEPGAWIMDDVFQKVIGRTERDPYCPGCSPGGLASPQIGVGHGSHAPVLIE